ncbi:MAG: 2-phospho-L-lactate guanylyltransferase [Verrucomicrobiota bacterium]
MINELCVVVPIKDPAGAKSRLKEVLSPEQREELAIALFRHLVGQLKAWGAQVLVVTESERMAEMAGTDVLKLDDARGETDAVDRAARWNAERGVRAQLVLPGDLATLTRDDFERLVASPREERSVVLCPATDDDGTNGILTAPPDVMPFRFGDRSFAGYQERARELGISCTILRLESLVLDIDTPDDLQRFMDRPGEHPARDLLKTWKIHIN